jgi:hypothetical protein
MISIVRVLGARQLLQAAITARRPTRRALELGAAVDAVHAATMMAGASANVGPDGLPSPARRPLLRSPPPL